MQTYFFLRQNMRPYPGVPRCWGGRYHFNSLLASNNKKRDLTLCSLDSLKLFIRLIHMKLLTADRF